MKLSDKHENIQLFARESEGGLKNGKLLGSKNTITAINQKCAYYLTRQRKYDSLNTHLCVFRYAKYADVAQ